MDLQENIQRIKKVMGLHENQRSLAEKIIDYSFLIDDQTKILDANQSTTLLNKNISVECEVCENDECLKMSYFYTLDRDRNNSDNVTIHIVRLIVIKQEPFTLIYDGPDFTNFRFPPELEDTIVQTNTWSRVKKNVSYLYEDKDKGFE